MIFTINTCIRLLRYEPALYRFENGDIRENIFAVVVWPTSFSIVLSFLRLSNDLFSTSSTSSEGSVITSKHSALVPDVSASATGSNFKQLFSRLSTLISNRQSSRDVWLASLPCCWNITHSTGMDPESSFLERLKTI